jgi:signal transduction histidine kinase/ligand-binding sensor domain-containing protein
MLGTVGIARGRARHLLALGTLLAGMLLAWRPHVFALDPTLDVSQYAHTAWKIREGFTKGTIQAMAQTPDGYLWLGTDYGLLRFDGVRNVVWQPPSGQHLPSAQVGNLLAARDGTLWIGTTKGLASWKGDKLTVYPELAGRFVFALFEDHEGTVWAGGVAFPPPGRLCAIQSGSVHCDGEDGSLGFGVFGLYEDSKGNLWVGVHNGLWRWRPGTPEFHSMPDVPDGIQAFAEDDDGALLIVMRGAIQRLIDAKLSPYLVPGTVQPLHAQRLFRDHDGGLWIATSDRGLMHVHQGRTDVFAQSDGLSGNWVAFPLLEDREGNIWVPTLNGLDRFREFAVPTFSVNQGLSTAVVLSVLAGRDGNVWLGTSGGLNRWNHGQVTSFGKRVGSAKPDGKLNGYPPDSLFQNDHGRIWVSTYREFGYLENDRFIPISGVPGGGTHSITGDNAGNLWIANQLLGLFHLLSGNVVQQIPWAGLGRKDYAESLIADPVHGGLWLGFYKGGIAYFSDGGVRAAYSVANGLGEGRVNGFRLDPDGTLWAAAEGGLSRLKNGRIATLSSKNGLPCDAVHWVIADDAHSFWLNTACGLVRIARSELDAWAAAEDKDKDSDPKRTTQVTVFDSSDGVRSMAYPTGFTPHVAKSTDGKLWFATWDGVSVIDPQHLPYNKLPPPVHVEQITADHKTYDTASDMNGNLRLPALIRDLEIDYTALSFVAPEKVRFRYKLEGLDRDWQDVGNRRQAFYTNLPPRHYRFRVAACNNSGVWNEEGAVLHFSVAPAYYQTTWFRVSCVAAFLALLWGLYQFRLRQLARQFSIRLEERVNERTRIARDLHDTMLQTFQGVLLKFYGLSVMLADRPEGQQKLEGLLEQGQQAINEGREAVLGLRSSTVIANDLARAFTTLGEELAVKQDSHNPVAFQVEVEGETRDLHPILRDEVYRIACEALRNAFQHSGAARIEVGIHYDDRQFWVCIRDNGKGIDPEVLDAGGREGHYGLPGMHERAKLAGGRLVVKSGVNSGTEAKITIPAARAYAKSRSPAGPHF